MLKRILLAISVTLVFSLHGDIVQREGEGFLEMQQSQRILHIKGSPYEMGLQQGRLLKDLIQKNVSDFIDNTGPELKSLKQTRSESFKKLSNVQSYVPSRFMEEMKGIAEGSEVPLSKILTLNLFPELFHCSGITVCDDATANGLLYHVRVLDYGVGKSLQNTAVIMVVEPENAHAFINVSYAGFIGSVTGMNSAHISMGEIGGWGYGNWNGMPMSFLFRDILERASNLEEAKQILTETPRTCEYYYVISDGKNNTSVGVYATASQIHFIEPGSSYALLAPKDLPVNYGTNGDHDKFCLAPSTLCTASYQTLLYDADQRVAMLYHKQPQHCVLMTGFTHPERYPLLVDKVLSSYGKIDENTLIDIIKRPVARESNLHNAIFLPSQLQVWISHAGPQNEPACDQPYSSFNLRELLGP